jgi:hypothetical protein
VAAYLMSKGRVVEICIVSSCVTVNSNVSLQWLIIGDNRFDKVLVTLMWNEEFLLARRHQ